MIDYKVSPFSRERLRESSYYFEQDALIKNFTILHEEFLIPLMRRLGVIKI
jgi:hypothetical protein